MLKFKLKNLETLAGMRMETTSQSFETDVPKTIAGKTGSISYVDFLPSIHFKYGLNTRTNLRLSYFNSINRPSYFEIVPTLRSGDEYDEIGNPKLLHAKADNLDFRFEFFPRPNEQILIGAFYKKITNPIEYGFSGDKVQFYQPQNFGNATNYGIEVVLEKYIQNFGIRINYTYTNSSITTTKLKTFNNQLVSPAPEQTRPLQGQSPHIANASLLYKNLKNGLDLQLAWQFTGERISLVSPYYEFDQWQQSLSLFDFSAEKKIGKHMGLFLKVQNLLNASDIFYINQKLSNSYPVSYQKQGDQKTLSSKSVYGQNYQIGLRYIL
jgi:TonB-dependent receptor